MNWQNELKEFLCVLVLLVFLILFVRETLREHRRRNV